LLFFVFYLLTLNLFMHQLEMWTVLVLITREGSQFSILNYSFVVQQLYIMCFIVQL